ncbi:MAG: DUF2927 domain-containing protein [Pseudomonadota bacterium]
MRPALAAAVLATALAACATAPPPAAPGPRPQAAGWLSAVPWGSERWGHESLAAFFRRLSLGFEEGGERPGLLRLAQPVRLAVEGPNAAAYTAFAAEYAALLTRETGVDIAASGAPTLTLTLVPAREARLPLGARCAHLPGSVGWADYRSAPSRYQLDAREASGEIENATVFIAAGLPPAAIRACILEEIPQAMGLGNDVSLLGPTIFNDDGAHLWPTRVDLLMLRLLYAPEMFPGSPPEAAEVAARSALARLLPEGASAPPLPLPPLSAALAYRRALAALGEAQSADDPAFAALRAAAPRAEPGAAMARCTTGLLTHRTAARSRTPARLALTAEDCAAAETASLPGTEGAPAPRTLRISIVQAQALLAEGQPAAALDLLDAAAPGLAALGNDAGLARLHHLRSRALSDMGRDATGAEAQAAAWARHAFGQQAAVGATTSD